MEARGCLAPSLPAPSLLCLLCCSEMCCAAVHDLVCADVDGGTTVEAVQLVADLVAKRKCRCACVCACVCVMVVGRADDVFHDLAA